MVPPSDTAWSVYYARDELHGYIKIGASRVVRQRLLAISADYRRKFTLLATEPGDRHLERRRHDQFDGCRLRSRGKLGDTSELFVPTDELMRHIQSLEPASGETFGREWSEITVRVPPHVAAEVEKRYVGTTGRSIHVVAEHALTLYVGRDDPYRVGRIMELESEVALLRKEVARLSPDDERPRRQRADEMPSLRSEVNEEQEISP